MRLILNGINGRYLREIPDNAAKKTAYVEAAVAYATKSDLLFDWCWDNRIPLRFWGRFDETVPVTPEILKTFLDRRSLNYACKLVRSFHSKIIWWHGVGAYIGSANLSDAAWYRNIEGGCFFDEPEMVTAGIDIQLQTFFERVDQSSTPLTKELYEAIQRRAAELADIANKDKEKRAKFLSHPAMPQWEGLLITNRKSASDSARNDFLKEWLSTLEVLRMIGGRISSDDNRPIWIPADVPAGAQADQFLHAYYYNHVIGERGEARSEEFFASNHSNPEGALAKAIEWWRGLAKAPSKEDIMLLERAPLLRRLLAQNYVTHLSRDDIEKICLNVWSIRDHARRVSNQTLGLKVGEHYKMTPKAIALANYLSRQRSGNGSMFKDVVEYVLYGGKDDQLPVRLWDAVTNREWRLPHVGISALGELVGWALPNNFPPRNSRTSKSLRSLGFAVKVHV